MTSTTDASVGDARRGPRWWVVAVAVLLPPAWYAVIVFSVPSDPDVGRYLHPAGDGDLPPSRPGVPASRTIRFTDVTSDAGIAFVHDAGPLRGYIPEIMGGGCAFTDLDGDDWPDILLVDSGDGPGTSGPTRMTVYRNDNGRFEDVSPMSGLAIPGYGMATAVVDLDGDGLPEVFVSAVGRDSLFHNLGEMAFEDVTERAGVGGDPERYSSALAAFDFDRDGDLDLFVGEYVVWSAERDRGLDHHTKGPLDYSTPFQFDGGTVRLLRNDGDLRFTDVTDAAGLDTGTTDAKTLGLRPLDYDADGWMDLFVANDMTRQHLFRNRGDSTFEEVGAALGVATTDTGEAIAGMGVDAERDPTGALSIVSANVARSTGLRFTWDADVALFEDRTSPHFGEATRDVTTFGLLLVDLDLDGVRELIQVNGSIHTQEAAAVLREDWRQPVQLFSRADGDDAGFAPVDPGAAFTRPMLGRGAAYADFDRDGDADLLLVANGGPARLLRNDSTRPGGWLRVRLRGLPGNPSAIGARLVLRAGDSVQHAEVMPFRSYLSQSETEPILAVPAGVDRGELQVVWPDGTTTEHVVERFDRTLDVDRSAR